MTSEEFFKLLINKISKIEDKIHDVDKTLVRQEENLKDHMRRSQANEEAVRMLSSQIMPIRKKVNMAEGALKSVGFVSLTLSIVGGLIGLFKYLGIL